MVHPFAIASPIHGPEQTEGSISNPIVLCDSPDRPYFPVNQKQTNGFESTPVDDIRRLPLQFLPSPSTISSTSDLADRTIKLQCRTPFRCRLYQKSEWFKSISLVLHGLDRDNRAAPIFGKNAWLDGSVIVNNTDGVIAIDARIEGHIIINETGEDGRHRTLVLSEQLVNWKDEDGLCPNMLPFLLRLPSTYIDGDQERALPPSFWAKLDAVPGFRACVEYAILISVSRNKYPLWRRKSYTLFAPFLYRPRTMPLTPISRYLTPSTVKYRDFIVRSKSLATNITCQLFLPSSPVWPVGRPIPFQLKIISGSLSTFLFITQQPSSFLQLVDDTPSVSDLPSVITSALEFAEPAQQAAVIRLYILRRVAVGLDVGVSVPDRQKLCSTSRMLWKTICGGEAVFRRIGMTDDWIVWKGEVHPNEQLSEPGFITSGLAVEDALILSIAPPVCSDLKVMRESIPLQFTTDCYREL